MDIGGEETMKVSCKDPGCEWMLVVNADTGIPVPGCISADDETGEFTRYEIGNNGHILFDEDHEFVTITKKKDIVIVDLRDLDEVEKALKRWGKGFMPMPREQLKERIDELAKKNSVT